MKVYPKPPGDDRRERLDRLPRGQQFLRKTAILIAFISVFAFFIKIVFL